MLKRKNLSKLERSKFSLSTHLKDILVGLILGDVCIRKQKTGVNVNIQFCQGIIHKDYLMHLYDLFNIYCGAAPKIINRHPNKITGKIYSTIGFQTFALPCFADLYDLFYVDGVKVVPLIIEKLLTPVGLAYWISDDGCWHKRDGYTLLCTDGFREKDVDLLVSALNNKFDLKCYKYRQGEHYRIKIPSYSILVLQSLLKDNMPSMMRGKIGL